MDTLGRAKRERILHRDAYICPLDELEGILIRVLTHDVQLIGSISEPQLAIPFQLQLPKLIFPAVEYPFKIRPTVARKYEILNPEIALDHPGIAKRIRTDDQFKNHGDSLAPKTAVRNRYALLPYDGDGSMTA